MPKENKQHITPTALEPQPTGSSESSDSDEPQASCRAGKAPSSNIDNQHVEGNASRAGQPRAEQDLASLDIEAGSNEPIERHVRSSHLTGLGENSKQSTQKAADNKATSIFARTPMGQFGQRLGKPAPFRLSVKTSLKAPLCSPVVTSSGTGKTTKASDAPNWSLSRQDGTALTPVLPTPTTPKWQESRNWREISQNAAVSASLPFYPVTRYMWNLGSICRILDESFPLSPRSNSGNDLACANLTSGDIIILCAALQEHGWSKADENRWWLVLGKVGSGYVLAPLATFDGTGKRGLSPWKAEYFMSIYKKPARENLPDNDDVDDAIDLSFDDAFALESPAGFNDEALGLSDEENFDYRLSSSLSLYSEDYLCREGSVVPLTTAFVVVPDQRGRIPARFDGFLAQDSFDTFWHCQQHLLENHDETRYLFQNNLLDWEFQAAKRESERDPERRSNCVSDCRGKGCFLGLSLR